MQRSNLIQIFEVNENMNDEDIYKNLNKYVNNFSTRV